MIKAGICMQFVNKWNQSTEKKWMNAKWTNIEDIIFYFIFFCKESQTSGKHLRYIEVCGSVILIYRFRYVYYIYIKLWYYIKTPSWQCMNNVIFTSGREPPCGCDITMLWFPNKDISIHGLLYKQ